MQNTKSVIDIEVNDDQFKEFHELFVKYQKLLGETPSMWSKVSDGITGATDDIEKQAAAQAESDRAHLASMRDFAAALMTQRQIMSDNEKEERKQEKLREDANKKQVAEEKRINDLHKERLKTTKDFASALGGLIGSTASIGLNIAKWGIGLGVGLLGGGFYGMERLGAGATAERSQARGLGVSAGELRAWQTDVGNYMDPSGLLGAASNAYADPNQRALFQRAGVGADVIRSGNTSQISEQALRGLIEFYNRNQGPNAAQSWSARGFDQLVSFGDIRRIAAAPATERERMFGALQRDTRNLNTSDRTMSAWQDFYTQLQRSGQVLKSTFLDGLVNLTGPLKELSGAAVDLVRDVMGSDGFRDLIKTISQGMRDLGASMKDGSFKKGVDDFISAFNKFANDGQLKQDLATLERVLHITAVAADKVIGTIEKSPAWGGTGWGNLKPVSDGKGGFNWAETHDNPTYGVGDIWNWIKTNLGPSEAHADTLGTIARLGRARSDSLPQSGDFTRYLSAIAQTESHGNPRAVSPAGALGMFQLMPATAREYGVSDPFNPQQAAQGAGRYLQVLRQMFQGDMLKTTAAYNAGQGRVQKAVQRYGGDWLSHMPNETQQYVGRVAKNFQAGNFNVNIQNATGGAATVTAAMAGG